jgi:transcriptional repressor NrdR
VLCPSCGDEENRVVDTRVAREGEEIRRRRECEECGHRFTTRERVELQLPKIIKRDERREDYKRPKLLAGIENACVKRPIRADAIDRLIDRVERSLQESPEKEISSARIGELVMAELIAIDALAAVRFASVFQGFERTEDYAAFFARLPNKEEGEGGAT